jgi:hypothetical protein
MCRKSYEPIEIKANGVSPLRTHVEWHDELYIEVLLHKPNDKSFVHITIMINASSRKTFDHSITPCHRLYKPKLQINFPHKGSY